MPDASRHRLRPALVYLVIRFAPWLIGAVALAFLLCGCAARQHGVQRDVATGDDFTPHETLPAAAPAPGRARRTAARELVSWPTVTLAWDPHPQLVTFNLYATADLKTWILLTNTPQTTVTVPAPWPAQFYCVTATNQNGESPAPPH